MEDDVKKYCPNIEFTNMLISQSIKMLYTKYILYTLHILHLLQTQIYMQSYASEYKYSASVV